MSYVYKSVFMQKVGNHVEVALFVKFRYGFIIIASRPDRKRTHILP